MGFYFGVFIILAFFSFLELFGLKLQQRNLVFVAFSLFLFCLSFLRWEVGPDWSTYHNFFSQSTEWFRASEFEWGFARLNELGRIVFNDYSILLFLLGSVLFGFQTTAIYKLSPYPITSLLFLWSISYGNAMFIRQSIATVILFYSLRHIINRNFWAFILLVVLATLFHRTSIIFLPAWWLYKITIKPTLLWIGVGISIFMTAALKFSIEMLSGVMGPIVQAKLDIYLSRGEDTFGASSSLIEILIRGFANKIFIFIILMIMLKKISRSNPRYTGLINIYWAGILFYFSTIGISVALVRLSFAYDILQIILIPMVFQYIDNKQWRYLFFIIYLFYLSMRFYIALTGSYYDMYVPFRTIFSQ